jgi:type III restriction enzyme
MLSASSWVSRYDAWIKSAFIGFYEIEFAWKKGEHPKRGKFSPDFFIKAGDLVLAIEVKHDDEIREPSDENRMKHKYASEHFARVNAELEKSGNTIRYQFHVLTPSNFGTFFTYLRKGSIRAFQSTLDVELSVGN